MLPELLLTYHRSRFGELALLKDAAHLRAHFGNEVARQFRGDPYGLSAPSMSLSRFFVFFRCFRVFRG